MKRMVMSILAVLLAAVPVMGQTLGGTSHGEVRYGDARSHQAP